MVPTDGVDWGVLGAGTPPAGSGVGFDIGMGTSGVWALAGRALCVQPRVVGGDMKDGGKCNGGMGRLLLGKVTRPPPTSLERDEDGNSVVRSSTNMCPQGATGRLNLDT